MEFAPAIDTTTYNGAMWQLARRTFFTNPDSTPSTDSDAYQRALECDERSAFGGIVGFPTKFLVDREGRIVDSWVGEVPRAVLEKQIQALL